MEASPPADPRIPFFDRLAETWDSSGPPIEMQIKRLDALRERLGLHAGDRVLEIGCGTGQVTGWLVQQVVPGTVTAIDFSPEMIRRTRERNPRVDARAWDICSAAVPGEAYDVAFCLHVVPHFRDHAVAFRNMADSLKPGGIAVVLHLSGRAHVNDVHRRAGGEVEHDLLPPADELAGQLRAAGFAIEEATEEPELFLVRARNAAGASAIG